MNERDCDPVILGIFDRETELNRWRALEIAVIAHLDEKAGEDAANAPKVSAWEVIEREQATGHEFTAFLDCWVEGFPADSPARRWVHYGLTSSDIIDTSRAWALGLATKRIQVELIELMVELKDLIANHGLTQQIGRTHGQYATVRDFETPWLALGQALERTQERLIQAEVAVRAADLSGPVGSRSVLGDSLVHHILDQIGLSRVRSTQVVPRDGIAHWANVVGELVTACEAICTQLWLLAQDGISEVVIVPAQRGYTGSSSMPGKVNPHTAESVMGIARLARALAGALQQGIVQFGDRDLAHNAVERVALPDLCHLAVTALARTRACLHDYVPDPQSIEINLGRAKSSGSALAYLEMAKLVAANGLTRQEAYNRVKEGTS